jgi:hypothetical protein
MTLAKFDMVSTVRVTYKEKEAGENKNKCLCVFAVFLASRIHCGGNVQWL